MAHTYTMLLYHIIFSTKHREPVLTVEARERIFPYMGGIISHIGGTPLIINGVTDHVHILCRLKSKPDVADVVQAIKGGSSSWFNKEVGRETIHWQAGYGAFTVSFSLREEVRRYIADQENHHHRCTFAEEYEAFLVANEVEFDRRFFLD